MLGSVHHLEGVVPSERGGFAKQGRGLLAHHSWERKWIRVAGSLFEEMRVSGLLLER